MQLNSNESNMDQKWTNGLSIGQKTEGQTTQTTQATNVGHINIPDNNNSTNNNRYANNYVYHNSKNGMREAVGIG